MANGSSALIAGTPDVVPSPDVASVDRSFQHQHLLDCHRQLDLECRVAQKPFVSGWHTSHPFARTYLPFDARDYAHVDPLRYGFLSDDRELRERIVAFHESRNEPGYTEEQVFITAGASPLILSQFLMLRALNVRHAYFVPPLYYTYFYFANMFGIEMRPASSGALHDPLADLRLPEPQSYLFITDPIWIMGVSIGTANWNTLKAWQRRTGSVIFVDGTFQYFSWRNPLDGEQSAHLERDRTIRLVCPTKALAVHGVRFAYLLLPQQFREEIRYACSNSTGATSALDIVCARRIVEVLSSEQANSSLIDYVRQRYANLRRSGTLGAPVAEPHATYYVFAEVPSRDRYLYMDQKFFGLTDYPSQIRFNLLAPYRFPGDA